MTSENPSAVKKSEPAKKSATDKIERLKALLAPTELKKPGLWKTVLTWVFRIITGALFIFSGFVKAIDPWGTIYKTQEYLAALNVGLNYDLVVTLVFALIAFEFAAGVFVLTGCYRRGGPVMVLLLMLLMLPLTFWIMVKNPEEDCGCFGDALILSNPATFWKNVALTLMGVWLLIYERRTKALVTPALQWLALVVTCAYIIFISVIGYSYQPLIDFRPYPEGGPIIAADDNDSHFTFVYEKDGKRMEVDENGTLPDEADGWKFVERKEVKSADDKEDKPAGGDLTIYDEDGEDVTHDVIASEGKQLIVFIPSMKDIADSSWTINSIADYCAKYGLEFLVVAAASDEEIAEWKDTTLAEYPIYTADDTQIKEVVRGNPALVYLENGKIRMKTSLAALSFRSIDFSAEDVQPDPIAYHIDNHRFLLNVSYVYLGVMAVLIMLSITPYHRLYSLATGKRRRSLLRQR